MPRPSTSAPNLHSATAKARPLRKPPVPPVQLAFLGLDTDHKSMKFLPDGMEFPRDAVLLRSDKIAKRVSQATFPTFTNVSKPFQQKNVQLFFYNIKDLFMVASRRYISEADKEVQQKRKTGSSPPDPNSLPPTKQRKSFKKFYSIIFFLQNVFVFFIEARISIDSNNSSSDSDAIPIMKHRK